MCFRLYCMYCKVNFGKTKSFFMKRFSSYLQWFWKEKLVCHRHLANCVNRAESSCFDSVLSDGDNARITKCFLSSYCFISVSSGTISTVASSSFFSDSPCLIVCACSRWLFALCFPWSPGLPRTVMGILLSDALLFLASISRTFDSVKAAFSELVSTSSGSVRLQQNRLRKHALVCFLSHVCSPTTNRSRPINFIERSFGSNPLTSMASW